MAFLYFYIIASCALVLVSDHLDHCINACRFKRFGLRASLPTALTPRLYDMWRCTALQRKFTSLQHINGLTANILAQKFFQKGCPNCEGTLALAGNSDTIQECTSQVFEGLLALNSTQSWVAKWLRMENFATGTYAVKVVGEVGTFCSWPLPFFSARRGTRNANLRNPPKCTAFAGDSVGLGSCGCQLYTVSLVLPLLPTTSMSHIR